LHPTRKFHVFMHFGRVSGTPGTVGAGPCAVVVAGELPSVVDSDGEPGTSTDVVGAEEPSVVDSDGEPGTSTDAVGTAVHRVQTVEVTVEETVMVEIVVPTSTLVVPAVV